MSLIIDILIDILIVFAVISFTLILSIFLSNPIGFYEDFIEPVNWRELLSKLFRTIFPH